MARILIVGCGCRGQTLARELIAAGHSVRGTTRNPNGQNEIEATGAEVYLGDPNRVGTLIAALDGVTIMCLLLGSARGSIDDLTALHTTRLEMLLQRTIDTTVRGITYEATGTIDQAILTAGAEKVRAKCIQSKIPYQILHNGPSSWLPTTTTAITALLASE